MYDGKPAVIARVVKPEAAFWGPIAYGFKNQPIGKTEITFQRPTYMLKDLGFAWEDEIDICKK